MEAPGVARKQLCFSDACRQVPEVARRFESLKGGITLDEAIRGQIEAPTLFLAASTRQNAFALTDEGTFAGLMCGS